MLLNVRWQVLQFATNVLRLSFRFLNFMKSQIETYDRIYLKLQDRLNKTGIITTNEAWKITKENYGNLNKVFRTIMQIMVAKKTAKKIKNGTWQILTENSLKT